MELLQTNEKVFIFECDGHISYENFEKYIRGEVIECVEKKEHICLYKVLGEDDKIYEVTYPVSFDSNFTVLTKDDYVKLLKNLKKENQRIVRDKQKENSKIDDSLDVISHLCVNLKGHELAKEWKLRYHTRRIKQYDLVDYGDRSDGSYYVTDYYPVWFRKCKYCKYKEVTTKDPTKTR